MNLNPVAWTAILACACGAAHAQSSVTLFGTLDVAVTSAHGNLANRLQVTSGGYNASRLGFRGVEDLGDGLRAGFHLEAQLNADNGTGVASNTNNQNSGAPTAPLAGGQGLVFHRRSTVSLMGRWGELRLGRDYTPQFNSYPGFDPFNVNGIGTSQTLVSGMAVGGSTLTRASNTVGYLLPADLHGFYGQAQVFLGENASNLPTKRDGSGRGARLGWKGGPVDVALAFGHADYVAGDTSTRQLAAKYEFAGGVQLTAMWQRDRLDAARPLTGRGALVGVMWPVGPHLLRAAYSDYRTDAAGAPKSAKLAAGYVHNLSKRTALYATAARLRNSGGATQALGNAAVAANMPSTAYEVGLKHSF